MEFKFIKYENRDHVAYLTINRPEVRNAVHYPTHQEMEQVWDDFAANKDLWVAVVTGAGEQAFSAGNDLKYTAELQKRKEKQLSTPHGFGGITERFDINKPIIAAVNGFALGGGFEIALACDIIIAADHASFGLPEPRVGLMAAAGGVHRLPRAVPLKVAMGMMLTGRHISAAEAQRYGVVNEVVPLKDLQATVDRWINDILECSPLAIQASKEAAYEGLQMPLNEALKINFPASKRLWKSNDVREGPRAFSEKRKPKWTGE